MSDFKVMSFLLLPCSISENTSVALESDGGDYLVLTIKNNKDFIRLETDEIFKLKEILTGLNKKDME